MSVPTPELEDFPDGLEETEAAWSLLEIHSAKPDWVRLSLPCATQAAEQLQDFLSWCLADHRQEIRETIRTVLREMLAVAFEWRGGYRAANRVRISVLAGRRAVLCYVANPGNGFREYNLLHAVACPPDGAACEHLEDRRHKRKSPVKPGLTIVRGRSDQIIYNQAGQELIFLKYLAPAAS